MLASEEPIFSFRPPAGWRGRIELKEKAATL
jgi:hypothetical protein